METVHNDLTQKLSQLMFFVGHCCLALLVHIDEIKSKIKVLRTMQEKDETEIDKIQGGSEEEFESNIVFL